MAALLRRFGAFAFNAARHSAGVASSFRMATALSARRMYSPGPNNKNELEEEISSYYGSVDRTDAYETCWGEGNIHLGYYPHLDEPGAARLSFPEAATALTRRMCNSANVNKGSKLIDFGCGLGGPAYEIAEAYGCQVTGMDLTPHHIEICNANKAKHSASLDIDFVVGSFTSLPDEVTSQKYSHVFSQVACCHVAKYTSEALKAAYSILEDGGYLVWCDFCGCESGPTQHSLEHFYKRLRLDYLVPPSEYCQKITDTGFQIVKYERLNKHTQYGYGQLERAARQGSFVSDDGVLLADNYQQTSKVIEEGYVGMLFVVARKV